MFSLERKTQTRSTLQRLLLLALAGWGCPVLGSPSGGRGLGVPTGCCEGRDMSPTVPDPLPHWEEAACLLLPRSLETVPTPVR